MRGQGRENYDLRQGVIATCVSGSIAYIGAVEGDCERSDQLLNNVWV